MSDRYQGFVQSPIGRLVVKNLGLPDPTPLRRYEAGAPLVDGTVALGGTGRLAESLPGLLDLLGIASTTAPDPAQKYAGLVFDATGLTDAGQLAALRAWFTPLLRDLPADRRPRHPAGADQGLRAGRAAGPRGLHPLARQGGRPRRHGPAGLRRREGRAGRRLDAGLPALAQVGVRVGPGRPGR